MKRLKIRGITGMPLFIVRFHGRLDGKRNVVAFKDGKWEGHYLQKKEAIFHSFVHRTYRELEEKTSQLHKESVSLAVEYHNILEADKARSDSKWGDKFFSSSPKSPRSYNRTDAPRQEADHKIEYGRN